LIEREVLNLSGLLSKGFVESIHSQFLWGLVYLGGLIIILVSISALQAIFFSRRIAGPIYAFARHLDQCRESQTLKPLKLRNGDLFSDLAVNFNRVVEKANSKTLEKKNSD